VDGVLL